MTAELPLVLAAVLASQATLDEVHPHSKEILVETKAGRLAIVDPLEFQVRRWIGIPGEFAKDVARSSDGRWIARLLRDDSVVVNDDQDGSQRARFVTLPWEAPQPAAFDDPDWNKPWWQEDRTIRFVGAAPLLVLANGHRATELWSLQPIERVAFLGSADDCCTTAIDISTDGALIATGDEVGCVRLWDPRSRELLQEHCTASRRITDLEFDSPASRLAIGIEGGMMQLITLADGARREYDLSAGDLFGRLKISDIQFFPSGRAMVVVTTTGAPSVSAWDAKTGSRLWETPLISGGNSFSIARFSPDGSQLLLSERGIVLDASNGALVHQSFPRGPSSPDLNTNGNVSWSADGDRLTVFTFTDRVRIRDLRITHPDDRGLRR